MKLIKATLLSLFVSLAVPHADAAQTNVVQNLNVHLWGVKSNAPSVSRHVVTTGIARVFIENRQIIQALGVATGNSFVPNARLVVVTPLAGGDSKIQVRDRNRTVDVTAFFLHQQLGDAVSGSESNSVTHRAVNLDFSLQRLALKDAEGFPALGLHFDVSGFSSEKSAAGSGISNLEIDASGKGDVNGALMILRGEVEVRGDRLEVVPGGEVSLS